LPHPWKPSIHKLPLFTENCWQYLKPLLFPGTLDINEAEDLAEIYLKATEDLRSINNIMTDEILKLQSQDQE